MIGYGMLYAAVVGVPIFLAALAGSAALRRHGRPERGVWLTALALALILPTASMMMPPTRAVTPSTGAGIQTDPGLVETGVLGLTAYVVVAPEATLPSVDDLLMITWLLASLLLALRWTMAAKHLANVGTFWRSRIVDGIQVWETPNLGPAVSGVFRPRILVPKWLLSMPKDQRALVLLHENEHVRARDPVAMAGMRMARILVPWNPVVWLLTSRLLHALELDCDRRVLRRRPDIETYGDTLLQVSARGVRPLIAAAAFTESHVPLQKRIVAMTTPPRSASVLGITTSLALGVLLVLGSCEVPIPTQQGPEAEAEQSIVESVQKNMVRLRMDRDDTVFIDGVSHPIEEVSDVVGPLYDASDGHLIASIQGDDTTPYRVMDQLQNELIEAGVLRVVFAFPEAAPSTSTSGLGASEDEGLPVVLPGSGDGIGPARPVTGEPGPGEVQVSARNLLHLTVRPDGIVEVRRGGSAKSQLMTARDIGVLWLNEVASNPNLIAAVKTHPEAPYRTMTEVLDALKAAKAERISIQVLQTG